MTELRELLAQFNRKERYWLIRDAVGDPFRLSFDFRKKLKDEIDVTIPCDAWWASDYHIDWLVAVLHTFPEQIKLRTPYDNKNIDKEFGGEIRGSQEDFDLVIAFEKHIILIEAKTGNFIDSQLKSKLSRLGNLEFGDSKLINDVGLTKNNIHISFVLCSPKKKIDNIKLDDSYDYDNIKWCLKDTKPADLHHIQLDFPQDTVMVSRCTDKGKKSAEGGHWAVYPFKTRTR